LKDRSKGYDKVLESLVTLKEKYPEIRYLIGGSFDSMEKQFLDERIKTLGLTEFVKMTGFIPNEELASYFSLADIYVMPSMKEGFGIVFIEAMYYGLPVISGNLDGSVDALCNGEFGIMVNPQNNNELIVAISNMLDNRQQYLPDQSELLSHFSYSRYKEKLQEILS
jgi:glycosyltransferase involved in cell wall biosynthesis